MTPTYRYTRDEILDPRALDPCMHAEEWERSYRFAEELPCPSPQRAVPHPSRPRRERNNITLLSASTADTEFVEWLTL